MKVAVVLVCLVLALTTAQAQVMQLTGAGCHHASPCPSGTHPWKAKFVPAKAPIAAYNCDCQIGNRHPLCRCPSEETNVAKSPDPRQPPCSACPQPPCSACPQPSGAQIKEIEHALKKSHPKAEIDAVKKDTKKETIKKAKAKLKKDVIEEKKMEVKAKAKIKKEVSDEKKAEAKIKKEEKPASTGPSTKNEQIDRQVHHIVVNVNNDQDIGINHGSVNIKQ